MDRWCSPVNTSPCHGEDRGFESRPIRQEAISVSKRWFFDCVEPRNEFPTVTGLSIKKLNGFRYSQASFPSLSSSFQPTSRINLFFCCMLPDVNISYAAWERPKKLSALLYACSALLSASSSRTLIASRSLMSSFFFSM